MKQLTLFVTELDKKQAIEVLAKRDKEVLRALVFDHFSERHPKKLLHVAKELILISLKLAQPVVILVSRKEVIDELNFLCLIDTWKRSSSKLLSLEKQGYSINHAVNHEDVSVVVEGRGSRSFRPGIGFEVDWWSAAEDKLGNIENQF